MSVHFQPSLFGAGEPEPDPAFAGLCRHQLDEQSWLDLLPGWLSGADTLFTELAGSAPWQQRDRWMYEQRVLEPRLTCSWPLDSAPDPLGVMATHRPLRRGVRLGGRQLLPGRPRLRRLAR